MTLWDDRTPTWNVLSLFAGIGGFELGLERAGMRTVGQVEINPFCRSVLARHWPDVPRHDDVRTARQWWLSGSRPVVDVVAGGYPCQPESTAGQRRGTSDERWLWPEMARVIYTLKPRWVIGENVIGHRTKGLRFVLRDLERLGYAARAGTVRARDLGAPHQRTRIFVLARRVDLAADVEVHGRGPGWARGSDTGASEWPQRQPGEEPEKGQPSVASRTTADPDSSGRHPRGRLGPTGQAAVRTDWWATEPDVVRMVHGLPGRVDRVRALGNAVVPQCAEHIGRIVIESDCRLRGCQDELVG